MKTVCVITDNEYLYENFRKIVSRTEYNHYRFDFYYSEKNMDFRKKFSDNKEYQPTNLSKWDTEEFSKYDLYLSLHCKQLFPKKLVDNYECINVHPGYNPFNRGWFPQVFSILNKKPVGVTIHKMDDELDHGAILYQEYVKIKADDTSWSVYQRIQNKEVEMLQKYLTDILNEDYVLHEPVSEGNIHYKSNFDQMCSIDLNKKATYGEVIDFLRAMTFQKYDNAYFTDEDGKKIYVTINLKKIDE